MLQTEHRVECLLHLITVTNLQVPLRAGDCLTGEGLFVTSQPE
jgi:hypothetical protein